MKVPFCLLDFALSVMILKRLEKGASGWTLDLERLGTHGLLPPFHSRLYSWLSMGC